MRLPPTPATNVDLPSRAIEDNEASTAQHCFGAGAVWDPPIGAIVTVGAFNEVQLRKAGLVENRPFSESVVFPQPLDVAAAPLHGLEQQQVAHGVLPEEIERKQRVTQVVQHAHQQDDIEPLSEFGDVIDGQLSKLDVHRADLGREAGLREIAVTGVESDNLSRPAPLHLDRVEAGVATDIEHGLAAEVPRHTGRDMPPENRGVVAQKVSRRRLHAGQVDIVEPIAQRGDTALDVRRGDREIGHRPQPCWTSRPSAACWRKRAGAGRSPGACLLRREIASR